MFTVKMITKADLKDGKDLIAKGTVIYEEEFNNLNEIDSNGFLGQNYRVEITNNKNNSLIVIEG